MQKLAAYRLEHDIANPEARTEEVEQIVKLLGRWLKQKRADDPEASRGEFRSERSDESGSFVWERARHGDRSWRMLTLLENLAHGRRFESSLSITDTGRAVIVYVTLSSGLMTSAVTPVPTDAKCPRPVRDILKLHNSWYHGATKIHGPVRVAGTDAGREFAEVIRFQNRTLPVIVISEDEGELALADLDAEIGRALVGLANVVVIDDEASWGITDVLGKGNSCFWGSVRVYWPRYGYNRNPFWTERRLHDSDVTAEQFAAQLRSMIMRVSALSVTRPAEIDEIRRDAQRARFVDMQARLRDSCDWEALADAYAKENDRLLNDTRALQEENDRLQTQLQNAEARLDAGQMQEPRVQPVAPEVEEEGPKEGEIHYYKKVDSTPKYDKMVKTGPCNHNIWQASNKADKAKKGIERLVGRKNWRSLYHCGSCEGGGLWKVIW